jgi:hypothetical protein
LTQKAEASEEFLTSKKDFLITPTKKALKIKNNQKFSQKMNV